MKVAVIGVGHLGKEHARVYYQLPEVELVAVVDTDEKQAQSISKRWQAQAFTDYRQILGKVDAVSVASPTGTHFEITRDFLEAGVHVLVEKPMTKEVEQAETLVRIAREKNLKLQVGHIERFNPAVMEIMQRNLQPVFIETLRLSPFRFRSGDVGVVLDLMIHDIDIVRLLVKSPVERVDAVGINLLGSREDICNARVSFECGCVANITASRASLKSLRQIRIFSPTCYVSIDYGTKKCKIYKKPAQKVLEKLNLQESVPKKFLGLSFEEIFFSRVLFPEKISMKSHEQLYAELESFVACIRDNTESMVPGEDGLEALRVAYMVTEDLQKNLERVKKRFAGANV